MNTQVDFYLLAKPDENARLILTCRLAEKAQRAGHQIFVHTNGEAQSQKLNELMWTFSQSSFLPHAYYDPQQSFVNQQPVLIHETLQAPHYDLLINLSTMLPENSVKFNRILEVLDGDEKTRSHGRNKFRDYKQNKFTIRTHHLSSAP